jgi:cell division protein FtsQ
VSRTPVEPAAESTPVLPVAGLPIPSRPHAVTPPDPPVRPRRKSLWSRSANRRVTVQSRSPVVWLGAHLAALGRRLLFLGKILAALAALAAGVAATRVAVRHVVASPRFAVQDIRVASGPQHVTAAEIIERTGVQLGDRLLAVDTDGIAARLAHHPWIASARVRRELPGTLVIDVTERQAAAVAVLDGLYLLDEQGHPFKRATLEEADGQVVLTGISRMEYLALPRATEAAFREALAVLAEYQHPDSLTAAKHASGTRPALSEVHVDPHNGFSLFLYDGGAEIRLGRGGITDKLARLDEILAQFGARGLAALRVVHLDGPAGDRVPIRLATPPAEPAPMVTEPAKPAPGARPGTQRAPRADKRR